MLFRSHTPCLGPTRARTLCGACGGHTDPLRAARWFAGAGPIPPLATAAAVPARAPRRHGPTPLLAPLTYSFARRAPCFLRPRHAPACTPHTRQCIRIPFRQPQNCTSTPRRRTIHVPSALVSPFVAFYSRSSLPKMYYSAIDSQLFPCIVPFPPRIPLRIRLPGCSHKHDRGGL